MTTPVPDADALEQSQDAAPGEQRLPRSETPLEAEPADVAEQDVVVPLDEDEGRG
jgi:hypothetical protein